MITTAKTLKKNDVIKVTSRHKLGKAFSILPEREENGKTLTENFYRVTSIEDRGENLRVTMVPDSVLGIFDCGFSCKNLHKSGKSPKPFGSDWEIVAHRIVDVNRPISLKGNPAYDLMM